MKWIKISVPDEFDGLVQEVPPLESRDPRDVGSLPIYEPTYRDVLDHGFIALVDFMGSDEAIAEAARVSYQRGTKKVSNDTGLIRYLLRHRHCYRGDMEVLTASGWKRWDTLGSRETFLVPDPETRTYRKEELPTLSFPTEETLCTFENERMSYAVTPDHKMYFKGKYADGYSKVTAAGMPVWGWFDPSMGYSCVDEMKTIPDHLMRFIGFYLGNGSYASENRISFHLKKGRKRKYLDNLLTALGFEYTVKPSSTYEDAIVYWVHTPDVVRQWIDVTCRAEKKSFDLNEIPNLSDAEICGLYDGLVNSDGSVKKDRKSQIEYSSVSPDLVRLFEVLGQYLGYDVHHNRITGRVTAYSRETRTSLESRKQYHGRSEYSGTVYCATTSTGLLMVRGGPDKYGFVCGNTTPFEMCEVKFHVKLPIFVERQWIRHRTACLAGDVNLDFQSPSSGRRYPMSIKKFHDLWHARLEQAGKPKEKPSYTERLEPGRMYSVPELAQRVERREEDIRNLIRRKSLSAIRIESDDSRAPKWFIDQTLWSLWADKRASVPYGMKRDRLKRMNLRFYNEETDQIDTTHVVDVWSNGVKPVYRVYTESGCLRLTADHLCYTDRGWLKLSEFVDLDTGETSAKLGRIRFVPGFKEHSQTVVSPIQEEWRLINHTKGYEVSNYGRVRSYLRDVVHFMKLTDRNGYLCVALQYHDGTQRTRQVHHLVLEAFQRERMDGEECRHLNGNPADNRLLNLKWGTAKENGEDRVVHQTTARNRLMFEDICTVEYDGEEEVYDLEVETPFHNFIADGFVVHNSINEMSARYSVLDREMYIPDFENAAPQSSNNKQGRAGGLTKSDYQAVGAAMEQVNDDAYSTYMYLLGRNEAGERVSPPDAINVRKLHADESAMNALLGIRAAKKAAGEEWMPTEKDIAAKKQEFYTAHGLAVTGEEYPGLARELARMVLPLSTYTQKYWKTNLWNLFNFLRLRLDKHAQYEIRVYAEAMYEMVQPLFPAACAAFDDYIRDAKTFSKMELAVIGRIIKDRPANLTAFTGAISDEYGMSKREIEELVAWVREFV